MPSDQWQQAKQALSEAMSLEGQPRAEFLQQLELDSPELAAEVQSLLAAAEAAEEEEFLAKTVNSLEMEETIDYQNQVTDSTYATIAPSGQSSDSSSPDGIANLIGEDYEIKHQIGKGGMGVVYKAYQHSLRRHVALKIIPDRMLRTPDEVARFKIEAESAAQLDHPGIVPVYEVGERCGVNYYSMALIEGESLSAYVGARGERLDQRRAAEIIEQVCYAVQYAHDRAVIHRDLKPDNILLDQDGTPRLTDFGLAKIVKEDEGLTMTGQVMGTPRYMAPEQATGNQGALSNRTDVYSLGSTLYALLAGRPPFGSETILQTIKQVAESPPPPLTQFSPHVSPDLQTICEKCLSKRPNDRYESAGEMAADLRRYLDGYPIAARPLSRWMRGYLWCRRNPIVAGLLTLTTVTLVVATIVSAFFGVQARRQLVRAEAFGREARLQLERAKANEQKLYQAIKDLFVFASENVLADEPGMQEVRKTLLESAQRYYQDLMATGQTSIDNLAQSAFLLGRVQASLGDRAAADVSFRTAAENYLKIVESDSKDTESLAALGQTYNEHARLREKAWHAQPPGASEEEDLVNLQRWQEYAQQCVVWREKAVESSPEDEELRRKLANAQMNLGYAFAEQGRVEGDREALTHAEELLQTAQTTREQLLEKDTRQGKVIRDVALGYASLADLRSTEAELEEEIVAAQELWLSSLELRTKAAKTLADLPLADVNADTEWLLATCYQVCGENRFQLGMLQDAIIDYQNMQIVMERLLLQNPRVQRYRVGVAQAMFMQSQLMLATNQDEGHVIFDECQSILVDAIAIDPRNQAVIDRLVHFSVDFATSLSEEERYDHAIESLERARQLLVNLEITGEGEDNVTAAIEQLVEEINRILNLSKSV